MVDSVSEKGHHLTTEEREIASFWADNRCESGAPAGHWLGITSQLATQGRLICQPRTF